MNIELKTQKNNLQTIFVHTPETNVGSVQFWFKAGSALESKENSGIAHFLEHMFFKGTKKRSKNVPAYYVESLGAEINAFTSFDYTCYYINFPQSTMLENIDILLDMVANAQFKKTEIPAEREVVVEEYNKSIDSPRQFQFMEMQKQCFTSGYAHPILGGLKTIKSFSQDQLKKFRNQYYSLSNSFLLIAGDCENKAKIEKKISEYKFPKGQPSEIKPFIMKKKPTIKIIKKDVKQATLMIGFQGHHLEHLNAPAEELAMNCLFTGETSPFYNSLVVDKTIATSIAGSSMYFNHGGIHFIKINCPIEKLDECLTAFNDLLKTNLKDLVDEENLIKIKNQFISSKIYEQESLESYAFSIGHSYVQSNDLKTEEKYLDRIKTVSLDKVHEGIKNIFSQTHHLNLLISDSDDESTAKLTIEKFSGQLKSNFPNQIKSIEKKLKSSVSKYDSSTTLTKLAPEIELLHRYNEMTPTYSLHTYMKGGLSHETPKNNGLYQLISRCVTYGHKSNSYQDIRKELESLSSSLNGFSGKNAIGLTQHGLIENFDRSFFHYSQTLTNPVFEDQFFQLEKELILRTIQINETEPVKQCVLNFNNLIFNGHAYERSMIGTKESIQSIQLKDLEEKYFERVNNSKILFSFSGMMSKEDLIEKLTPIIDKLKIRSVEKISHSKPNVTKNQNKNIEFDREQTHIIIGKQSYASGHKNDLLLSFLTTYLSGQSSPLFLEVRDRMGLCYSVNPIQHTALEAGYWGIYIGSGFDKADKAIEAIMNIINNIAEKGFSKSEFKRIKIMLKGQHELSLQTNDDHINFYSIPLLHGLGLDFGHKSFNIIDKIQLEDLNKFLKGFLKSGFNQVTVGRNQVN
ncbi:insulinase family protein [Bacteriovoracaceae bacterium]|nr:insulinase family protein [Bacteriovoracaceae bacterium]